MGDYNGDHKPDEEFNNKTYIYIRTNPVDIGIRPLPAGNPYYISPDITIIRPGGIRGSEGGVGEVDQVEVVVNNAGGIDAIDAYVEAFLTDPSTGFTPALATWKDAGFLTIPNHNLAAITFPWTPTAADAGHRCMFARVSLITPFDSYTDPASFDVVNDRHIAQRNLSVIKLESIMTSYGFVLTNPLNKPANYLLEVKEVSPGRNEKALRAQIGSRFGQFAKLKLGNLGLALRAETIRPDPRRKLKTLPVGILREKIIAVPREKKLRVTLKPEEIRHAYVSIQRNKDIRAGDISIVQVQQMDAETKAVVGGFWLIVVN